MGAIRVGQAIEGIVGSIQRDNPELSSSARVKTAWNNIAPKEVTEHVVAVFVVPNTQCSELIVYTDTSIAAADLAMQAEVLRLKLNVEIARSEKERGINPRAETVKTVRFAVSKERYTSKKREKTTTQEFIEEEEIYKGIQPLSLSDEEKDRLGEVSASIENEELRQAAFQAAKVSIEWDKGLSAAGR